MKAVIENVGDSDEKVFLLHTDSYTYSHVELSVELDNGIFSIDELSNNVINRLLRTRVCDIKSTITFDIKKRDWVEVPALKNNKVVIQFKNERNTSKTDL
jgi:hypothetical protein